MSFLGYHGGVLRCGHQRRYRDICGGSRKNGDALITIFLNTCRVRYGAGWGGFSLARPRRYTGTGGYFWNDPHPPPVSHYLF